MSFRTHSAIDGALPPGDGLIALLLPADKVVEERSDRGVPL